MVIGHYMEAYNGRFQEKGQILVFRPFYRGGKKNAREMFSFLAYKGYISYQRFTKLGTLISVIYHVRSC